MPSFDPSHADQPSSPLPSPSTRRPNPTNRSPSGPQLGGPMRIENSSPTAARHGRVTLASTASGNARDAMTDRHINYPPSSPLDAPGKSPTGPKMMGAFNDEGLLSPNKGAHADMKSELVAKGESAFSPQETGPGDHTPSATGSQKQLNEYREKLARDLERRELSARGLTTSSVEKARVSPILEENSPLPTSTLTTTSTESGQTIRGGITPGPVASTPSYPFPRMAPPGFFPNYLHRPFTTLSPTGAPRPQGISFDSLNMGIQDRVLSGTSTPASNFTFNPQGASPHPENLDFPSPSLYDLSLMLAAEPGLDAWWNTVIQIMRDVYKAERVTLAVPADSTDIENVPWGQKATYNEHQEDDRSLGYLARGSSAMPSSDVEPPVPKPNDSLRTTAPVRPGLQSRHSFTSYEDNREKTPDPNPSLNRRPSNLMRSQSYFPWNRLQRENPNNYAQLNKRALDVHDAAEEEIPSWEAPFLGNRPGHGRVLPVLQALDFEADPLIDHSGVMRVLDRGKVIALTRSYPYLATSPHDQATQPKAATADTSSKKAKKTRSESFSKLSSFFGVAGTSRGVPSRSKTVSGDKWALAARLEDEIPRPPTPKYEEFEQAPPSPWSQSPAPSPAVRSDPKENPFFTDAMVDEDSFNPDSAPADYTAMRPPEAIGVDNSWTVLHIPLSHVLLSKPVRPFKLDSTAMEQKSHFRSKSEATVGMKGTESGRQTPDSYKRDKPAPIAILSILSPIIPYPSNLRHSLEHLAPHLATTFSMCRHYSNLETELAGLQRKRPQTAGFGAVAPDGRPLENPAYLTADDLIPQQSLAGSMTSPSDYSAVSKSATGSPSGTPGWDQGAVSYLADKRQPTSSPAAVPSAEGYFSSKQRPTVPRQDTFGQPAFHKSRGSSKDGSPADKRHTRLTSAAALQDVMTPSTPSDKTVRSVEDPNLTIKKSTSKDSQEPSLEKPVEGNDEKGGDKEGEKGGEKGVDAKKGDRSNRAGHTVLHSYGADFASTFQSLPPSSSLVSRPAPAVPTPSRGGSITTSAADMPPPSDRLKGLILDSLPAHVFVALPQTGEIVWVNSRYLSYRGQTVTDLAADPWGSLHVEDREEYLKAWGHSVRTGEQFSRTVRIRRFDGAYRWFYARAVASKDKRGVIMQFLGSYMDIHDQHIAELKAARQQEIEASEAKHRLLANLIPQIIFTATEDEGITFANEQWLSYTGQSFDDSLGLGFVDFVHPDDLAKCRIPTDHPPAPARKRDSENKVYQESQSSEATSTSTLLASKPQNTPDSNLRGIHQALSRNNSSSTSSLYELPAADLTELARKGIIKVATDSNGRLSYTTEVRLRSKSGEYRWHLIRCVEIDTIDFGNGASSYFGSATDINDHKLLEVKLKEAMESKSRFLSNMSHEIRTPLIGISGMVSFLQDTTLNEEQLDYTNTIQTSANSLIMIINDILDLSKVDAGMMKLKFEWFHTRSLIEDVNELVSTMAIAKRLELNYLVEADVPAWVKGDKVRIRQVLLNVIGNAIKFTAEGEVFSRCRVYSGEDSRGSNQDIMLEFAITDTGRGFSKEEADLIFKPFSQIDGSSTRQHGGSGLGLVISRQLVELHGGKMEGTAVLGKGSTFTFTARFALPTAEDHPNLPPSPASLLTVPPSRQESLENVPSGNLKALPPPKQLRNLETASPNGTDSDFVSPSVPSTASSDPSVHSSRSHITDRSSVTSVNTGLARFSEAAKASGQDLSQMKLEMPSGRTSPGATPTPGNPGPASPEDFRPPMYSILIICPQFHSREATTQHIEMTLPKDVPHQITALSSVEEAQTLIGGDDPIKFTHIVINLGSPEAIIGLMDQISKSQSIDKTTILVLSDSVQRQAVVKLAADTNHEELLAENLVTFIYKPVKPSRFAVIFDPNKVRDLSIDRNRSTAQQMVENQKASYQEIEKRMGNKGYKVLLVEDNPVNQKVLMKYLKKIGVEVEVAVDGAECTDMVFSKPHKHYSLILCDLHMPRKDGYQACREIRQWEQVSKYPRMPIIALSANVMSDVQDKCVAAGFSDYVTKPVDFIDLSRAMSKFF